MASKQAVTLASNGRYWLARYYDSLGRRKGKILGPKSEVGKRQAQVLCERFAVELHGNPARADASRAPTLAKWLESFLILKPDLGEKGRRAYSIAAERFMAFAGEHTRIDRVTPATAAEWVAKLTDSPARQAKPGEEEKNVPRLSPGTVANYSRHVRCLFNEAVHQGILLANPFARIRTQPRKIERSWHYVPRELFSRVLDACPSRGWQCFLALQRIGALRKGEALTVTWEMVDLGRRLLTLPASITKTDQERIVPLDPELLDLLAACRPATPDADTPVVPWGAVDRDSDSNQHHRFRTILKGAKVAAWEDLFQTLRRNAVQDLREKLKDPWAVTAIAGHSEEVERKYYLGRVRQADLDRITGAGGDARTAELLDMWGKLGTDQQSRLLALLRAATVREQTGTKTGTTRDSENVDAEVEKRKEPGKPGSNRSAPRRTRTFDPLIKSQLLYQLS
jgi:integrase